MCENETYEVVLWMRKCDPGRLTANRTMLCIRNIFLLENNMMDIDPEQYHSIITASGSAGIIRRQGWNNAGMRGLQPQPEWKTMSNLANVPHSKRFRDPEDEIIKKKDRN